MDNHDEDELQKERLSFICFIIMIDAMPDTSTIFTPRSNTLSDKVKAYQSVADAFDNINQVSTSHDTDLHGEKEDVAEARKIISSSMAMATGALTKADLAEAQKLGLMDKAQVQNVAILRQQFDFEKQSKEQKTSKSDRSGQKP